MSTKMLFRLVTTSLALFILATCEYEDYPDPIWDPDDAGNTTPTITSIEPANLAYEGITMVTIEGEHFASVSSQNQVTFNGYAAAIDEASSTANSLVVKTPVIIEDDTLNSLDAVQIIVAAQGAYAGAVYDQNFTVERAVIKVGGFAGEEPPKNATGVASDVDGNLFVATAFAKKLYLVDTSGVRVEYAAILHDVTTDMKVGPDGYIYSTAKFPIFYRLDTLSRAQSVWHGFPGNKVKKIACFDFNIEQDIYCGGITDSLYILDIDTKQYVGVATAADHEYFALRVFDGYVYVAGQYIGEDTTVSVIQGVWKHEILSGQDTLGTRELVYNWGDYTYSDEQDIDAFVMDENGLLYIGVTNGSGPAIVNLDPITQVVSPFYEAVTAAPITNMFLGNGNFIYAVTVDADNDKETTYIPIRIALENNGAPYYGY